MHFVHRRRHFLILRSQLSDHGLLVNSVAESNRRCQKTRTNCNNNPRTRLRKGRTFVRFLLVLFGFEIHVNPPEGWSARGAPRIQINVQIWPGDPSRDWSELDEQHIQRRESVQDYFHYEKFKYRPKTTLSTTNRAGST